MFVSVLPYQERMALWYLVLTKALCMKDSQDGWISDWEHLSPCHSKNLTLLPGSALPVLQVPRSHSGDGTAALIFKSQVILIWSDHTAQVSWYCNGPKVLTFVYQNLKVRKLNHQSFCHTQIYISIAACIKYACAFAFKHFLREMTC